MKELKTLIDLCPGTRLPQYEEEIFSDEILTDHYLRKLCEQHGDWYDLADSLACAAYYYALHVMGERWPAAESVIITDPTMSYLYAWLVMGEQWPDAEPVIAMDNDARGWYNEYFGTCI